MWRCCNMSTSFRESERERTLPAASAAQSHYKSSQQYCFFSIAVFGWINSGDLARDRHCGLLTWVGCQPLSVRRGRQEHSSSLLGIMNIKSCIIDWSEGEFIHSRAKLGNVSRWNRWPIVHLCPPNHSLMATINCGWAASASNTVTINANTHTLAAECASARLSCLMYWLSSAWPIGCIPHHQSCLFICNSAIIYQKWEILCLADGRK